ncbi:MAG: MFS transporter [Actinomycetota bacterium]|nr:MFS transporter [Actinomycetota bacterium]
MSKTRRYIYYGWLVVGVAFMVMFVNYGVRYTKTVIIKDIVNDLGIGRGAGSLPFTVSILVYALLAPVVGKLVDRYGPRWVMMGGAILAGLGLWMCSRINSLAAFIFCFGIVFGIGGNGIGLVPSNTAVTMWFRRHLGLALGIATMGIGFGAMILPRVTGMVNVQWGWRTSFQFLGYVAWALVIPVFFLLRPRKGKAGGGDDDGDENPRPRAAQSSSPPGDKAAGGLSLRSALHTPSFWLLFFAFVLIVIAMYGVMLHQVPFATDRGIDKGWADWSITIVGATSILGRFFFGWMSDRTSQKKQALYPACVLLLVSLTILIFVRQVWSLMLFSALFGFGYAAYGPVIPAIVAEVFGKANMGVIFGAVTTGGATGGATGPYITGLIFDASGGYVWAWILGLACVAVSTILLLRVRIVWKEDEDAHAAHAGVP